MPSRPGMSLIETLIAITVMGTAAIMYASAWSAHSGAIDVGREIEIATELFARQVERLRMKQPSDGFANTRPRAPFFETAFQQFNPCPPRYDGVTEAGTTFYRAQGAADQLSYNTPMGTLLDATNSFLIPVNTPADAAPSFDQAWVPALPPELGNAPTDAVPGMGFAVEVRVARIQEAGAARTVAQLNAGSNYQQLIKFRIIVRRMGRHVMSGEIIQEVR